MKRFCMLSGAILLAPTAQHEVGGDSPLFTWRGHNPQRPPIRRTDRA